jgi:hypothetical protein
MQPSCDGLYYEQVLPSQELAQQTAALPTGPEPAAWGWLAIILAIAVFEGWALKTHHHTLSQWFQHQHFWVRLLGASLLGVLIWHLFHGF